MRTKRRLALLLCVTLTALLWAVCLSTAALAEPKRMNINYNGSITIEPTTLATGEAGWSATQRQGSIVITGTYADPLIIEGDRSPTGNVVRISDVGSDAAPMLLELSAVNIEASGTPFYIDGAAASNVTMTVLDDYCTIHKNDGESGSAITVPASSTFTVKGPGKLTVKASNNNGHNAGARGSAFGGEPNRPCGNIIFDGAYVEAYAECGAAIGGCNNTYFADNGGNILVKGGSRITATSTWGAAIGGGGGVSGEVCSGGDGGTLTIESGTVTATSTWGAAIGGGGGMADSGGSGGKLIMRGGILKATSTKAAAIGGGDGNAKGAVGTVILTDYRNYQWSNVDDTDASYQTTAFVNDNLRGFRGIRPASAAASTATGTTVAFGKVVKGTTPAAKTMVVMNMGREAITVSHAFAQGAGNFACSATPSTAVAATNGETVRLDLLPTDAALQTVGMYTADGTITATNTTAGYSQQDGFTVTMNVIDVPALDNIAAPPAIAHNGTLALPAINVLTDNGSAVTTTGHQLSKDGFSTIEYVTAVTPIPYAKNGYLLRAFAENEAGRGYTNAVRITVREPVVVDSVTVTPATASVTKGGTQGFAADVSGTGSPAQTVTWSVAGKTSSSTQIDGSGTLTIGADETAATLIVTATSTVDTSKSGSAIVTVASPLLTITPYGGTSYPVGGATENAKFRITATGTALDATHYASATLDGHALDLGSLGRPGADGSVENGSIHVIINRAKLNTLTPGTHTLIVTLRDGAFAGQTVTGVITVTPHPVPKTGDNTPLRGWVLLMALSCCGVALLTFHGRYGKV